MWWKHSQYIFGAMGCSRLPWPNFEVSWTGQSICWAPHLLGPRKSLSEHPGRPPGGLQRADTHHLQNSTSNVLQKCELRSTTCVWPWSWCSHRTRPCYSGRERRTCHLGKNKISSSSGTAGRDGTKLPLSWGRLLAAARATAWVLPSAMGGGGGCCAGAELGASVQKGFGGRLPALSHSPPACTTLAFCLVSIWPPFQKSTLSLDT